MNNRTVKIASPKLSRNFQIETAATTWGELKIEIKSEVETDGMKGFVRETRGTLEVNDAVLPEGDFTILLSPISTKSGASVAELKAICTNYGIEHGRKVDMVARIEMFEAGVKFATPTEGEAPEEEVCTAVENNINRAIIVLETVVDSLRAISSEGNITFLSKEESEVLASEADEISKLVAVDCGC